MTRLLDVPGIRELRAPLTSDQLRRLEADCRVVQFCEPLSAAELRRLTLVLAEHPAVRLRVYGHATYPTLDFLEHVGGVRRLWIDIHELQDFAGLRFLRPDLEQLGLGATRRRVSLRPLERFTALANLWLDGHRKDFDVVGELRGLRRLSLRSITLPDLGALRTLDRLEELELKLGGTRDLRHLPEIGQLRYFEAWLVRGLADLAPLADVRSLHHLMLQSLARVVELPSFARSTELHRVHLQDMKGLRDLAPVAAAPALQELVATRMAHMGPEAFRPFIGHPRLRTASIGLDERASAAVDAMLRLSGDMPAPRYGSQRW